MTNTAVSSANLQSPASVPRIGKVFLVASLLQERIQLVELRVRVQALILSFNEGFARVTRLFLCCIALVFFLKRPTPGGAGAAGAH